MINLIKLKQWWRDHVVALQQGLNVKSEHSDIKQMRDKAYIPIDAIRQIFAAWSFTYKTQLRISHTLILLNVSMNSFQPVKQKHR